MGILTFLDRSPRAAKADDTSLKLHNEFCEKSYHPLDTRPQ
jgi:hypothetical protein